MQKTMAQLKLGETGKVKEMLATGRIRQRLFDMGITPGTEVLMVRRAPLGDPFEIKLRGYQLSLRKAEGDEVIVEVKDA